MDESSHTGNPAGINTESRRTMKAKEESVMAMYRATRPTEFIAERSKVKHLPWSLLILALFLAAWLMLALNNTENQRNALATRVCQDHVFPAEIDYQCLAGVRSREHWWQNVLYALTHPFA